MTTKIIEKLIEIESALRALREEIVLQSLDIQRKDLSEVDLGSLVDVTPESWKHWFGHLSTPVPAELFPYQDALPDLLVGFPAGGPSPARMEQRASLANKSSLRYSINVWLSTAVDWFTVEFRLPANIVEANALLYFAWTGSVNVSQRIRLILFQRDSSGHEFRSNVSDMIFPSLTWSEIKLVNIEPRPNIKVTKLLFEFPIDSFQSISLDDIRLYAPGTPEPEA